MAFDDLAVLLLVSRVEPLAFDPWGNLDDDAFADFECTHFVLVLNAFGLRDKSAFDADVGVNCWDAGAFEDVLADFLLDAERDMLDVQSRLEGTGGAVDGGDASHDLTLKDLDEPP